MTDEREKKMVQDSVGKMDDTLHRVLEELAKKIEFEQAQENDREVQRLMFRYILFAEGWLRT